MYVVVDTTCVPCTYTHTYRYVYTCEISLVLKWTHMCINKYICVRVCTWYPWCSIYNYIHTCIHTFWSDSISVDLSYLTRKLACYSLIYVICTYFFYVFVCVCVYALWTSTCVCVCVCTVDFKYLHVYTYVYTYISRVRSRFRLLQETWKTVCVWETWKTVCVWETWKTLCVLHGVESSICLRLRRLHRLDAVFM